MTDKEYVKAVVMVIFLFGCGTRLASSQKDYNINFLR